MTLQRKEDSWLEGHVRSWVDAGLITDEQAMHIKEYEHVGGPAPPQRLTLATEVAAYVGSVLALMGGGAVVGSSWEDISFLGRIGVGLVVMAVGFATGTWLVRLGEAGMERLGWFLWAVGTGGVAIATFAMIKEIDPDNDGAVALGVGAAVLAVSLVLWRNMDRPLQLLTTAIGFAVVVGGLSELIDPPVWLSSLILVAVGAGLAGGAAVRRIEPRVAALCVGSVSAYVGGILLTDTSERLGTAVALVIAILVVVVALHERIVPVLVLGVGGSLIATQGLLATTFTGAASALIVTALGVAIVFGAIVHSVRGHDATSATPPSQPATADRKQAR
jgi:hypothetical protein